MLKIYTKTGDDGTTGLLFGGRVAKDSAAHADHRDGRRGPGGDGTGPGRGRCPDSELDQLLTGLERDLYVLMAEATTDPVQPGEAEAGATLVTDAMVVALEAQIDDLIERFEMPTEFVVPGANRASAALDLARTVVRRAERLAVADSDRGLTGPDVSQPALRPAVGHGPLGRG